MQKMDHHRWYPPLDEVQLIADAVGRVLDSQGHEGIRDVLGDVDALEDAVERLETYERFRPGRFDRRKLNRRLKQADCSAKESTFTHTCLAGRAPLGLMPHDVKA